MSVRAAGVVALLLSTLSGAVAAPPEVRLSPGFGRCLREDQPAPVRIDVTALDQPFQGTITIPIGLGPSRLPQNQYQVEMDVPAGGSKRAWVTVWPSRYQAELSAVVSPRRGRRRELVQPFTGLPEEARLIGVVSSDPGGLRFLNRPLPQAKQGRPGMSGPPPDEEPKPTPPVPRVADLRATDLPPDPAAYGSLTALVLSGDEFGAAEAEVKQAVAAWTRGGGHLVLVGGVASAGLWQEAVLQDLLPVDIQGTGFITPRDLEDLAGAFRARFEDGPGRYGLTHSQPRDDARVLFGTTTVPLVVRRAADLGRVTFVALPFDQPPLRLWGGQEAFWRELLEVDEPAPGITPEAVLGAVRDAAVNVPRATTPSAALVAGFLVLYLFVLIPLQFPLLKKLKRRELAWVTTPLIVLVFSLGAFLVGRAARSQIVTLDTVSLLNTASGSHTAEAYTATVIFSPGKRDYVGELHDLPGRVMELDDRAGYNYYDSSRLESEDAHLTFQHDHGTRRLADLAFDMWSFRVFGIQRWRAMPKVVTIRATESLGGQMIRGKVYNGLSQALQNPVVVYGTRHVRMTSIPAGGQAPFSLSYAGQTAAGKDAEGGKLPAPTCPFEVAESSSFDGAIGELVNALPRDEPALLAWLTESDSPLTLASTKAKARELSLLRVRFTPVLPRRSAR